MSKLIPSKSYGGFYYKNQYITEVRNGHLLIGCKRYPISFIHKVLELREKFEGKPEAGQKLLRAKLSAEMATITGDTAKLAVNHLGVFDATHGLSHARVYMKNYRLYNDRYATWRQWAELVKWADKRDNIEA